MIQEITRSAGHYGVGFDLMAAIQVSGAVDISQYDIDSLTYEVWDRKNPDDIATDELDPTEVVYDERQTDNDWNLIVDPDGWNFLWAVPGSLVPLPGREYVFLISGVLTDNEPFRHKHIHTTWKRT